jgi:phosphatidylglycerophosphate synthase
MNKDKIFKITAWVIAGALTALYLFSAYGKLSNPAQMEAMKLGDWGTIIAIGEIVSALLFLIPKTNRYGTLLLSSYMGGAIIIHMTSSISIIMPSVVLILVWVVAYLRNPEYFCKSKTEK